MKKLFLILGLLFLVGNVQAVQKYKISTSTKTANVGYTILGSQKYEICADTASAPVITISSWTVNLGGKQVGTEENVRVGTATLALSVNASNVLAGTLPTTVICSSIAVNAVGIAQINATGTPSGATFLDGSGNWTAPGGVGDVVLASTQTFTGQNTFTGNTYGVMPTGSIIMYGSTNTIPTGFLYCDGSAISRTTYAALFAVIGTTFGAGDTTTTFNIPDFRGVFAKGAGTTNRAAGKDASGNYYAGTLGSYVTDKMQGHKHTPEADLFLQTDGTVVGTTPGGTGGRQYSSADDTGIPSDDGTNGTPRTGHTTEPQSLGINFIIKY